MTPDHQQSNDPHHLPFCWDVYWDSLPGGRLVNTLAYAATAGIAGIGMLLGIIDLVSSPTLLAGAALVGETMLQILIALTIRGPITCCLSEAGIYYKRLYPWESIKSHSWADNTLIISVSESSLSTRLEVPLGDNPALVKMAVDHAIETRARSAAGSPDATMAR